MKKEQLYSYIAREVLLHEPARTLRSVLTGRALVKKIIAIYRIKIGDEFIKPL